jgi:hypothetical protein
MILFDLTIKDKLNQNIANLMKTSQKLIGNLLMHFQTHFKVENNVLSICQSLKPGDLSSLPLKIKFNQNIANLTKTR